MKYLAVLQTEDSEYVCMSTSEKAAKKGVYEGYNTFVKKLLETEHKNPLQEVTSEWLTSRLDKYYRHFLGGKVGMETLEKKWELTVLELIDDKCYRDGFETPRREQDY